MNKEIPLEELLKENKINQRTYDKVKIAKKYIEHKYNLQAAKYFEWNEIINHINSLKICEKNKQKIKKEIYKKEMIKFRKSREKQSIRDYESIAIIGRGAFGEVHVCREKTTNKIYAIKKIQKNMLIIKNQIIHILNEQFFMSRAKSQWIVELKESFQEDDYLYLVMEYLPGGDLMNLLIKKDIFTEDEARFYLSELILAIESIHKLDCIHRDIKPDNILIDKNGHIKLSDFGLAKISDKLYEREKEKYKNYINNKNNNKKKEKMTHNKNFSCVGTPYYIAPEVLNAKGYDKDIDWWSAGVIFFEMLVGYAHFCSKQIDDVCYRVLNWKKYLKIPNNIIISEQAKDLIFKMINNSDKRLGKTGADEIKKHPFFNGIDWDNIKNMKPPIIPILKNEYDTSYFENFEVNEPFYPITYNNIFKRKDIEYIGYTFKEDLYDNNDLNKEYEQAIKSINEKENIDLNCQECHFNNKFSRNKNNRLKNKINIKDEEIKNIILPLRKGSIPKQRGKNFKSAKNKKEKLYKMNFNKFKELFLKINQYKKLISPSNNIKKNMHIIQLPQKKLKPIFDNKKMLNLTNCSNQYNNTMYTFDDKLNTTNNYSNQNVKTYNNINKINISRNKNINKLNIPINNKYKNNNKFSHESKDNNKFVKKYFLNKKCSKDKLISTNSSLNNIKSPRNLYTSRVNNKNSLLFSSFYIKRNSYNSYKENAFQLKLKKKYSKI